MSLETLLCIAFLLVIFSLIPLLVFFGHLRHYRLQMASNVSQIVVVLVNRELKESPVNWPMLIGASVEISRYGHLPFYH